MGRLMKSGICYTGTGGGGSITYTEITLAEYEELTYEQKHNGELYFITDVDGDKSFTDLTDTLEAGETELVFTDASITTNSTIDVYTDTFGVNPTNVTVSAGSVTLTFASKANDLACLFVPSIFKERYSGAVFIIAQHHLCLSLGVPILSQ